MNSIEKLFHPISLDDKDWIEKIVKDEYLEICDQTFGMSFAGRETYNIRVANICDCVVYRYDEGDFHSFCYPIGKNSKNAVNVLIEYLREFNNQKNDDEQMSIGICPATFGNRTELLSLGRDDILIEPTPDYFDYVYLSEDLSTLKGGKYSAKRNHINRFTQDCDWSYESLDEKNTEECLKLEELWRTSKEENKDSKFHIEDASEEYDAEELEIKKSLENLSELGFFGSVIRKNGQIVAFSICEAQNEDTVIVHYEKAVASIQGAYQIINRETVIHADEEYRRITGKTDSNKKFVYVNREDDLGLPGLRKAKESYYPHYMGRKYYISISDVVFASEADVEDIKNLWIDAFGDPKEYVDEYISYCMKENAISQKWLKESILVIRKNGHIATMGSFLEGKVTVSGLTPENEIEVRYVYGLATDRDYRGRGFCNKLIQFAKKYYGCPLVLKPVDEKLRDMYKKIGFEDLSTYDGLSSEGDKTLILTDDIFTSSNGEIIDECDYKEGLMIYA